jgi:hypothetical protein
MSTKNDILPKPFTLRAVLLRLCFANLSPSEKALKAVRKICFLFKLYFRVSAEVNRFGVF